jgi:streptogramin lyase
MNQDHRRDSATPGLPGPARRAVHDLRRLELPPGLLGAVMREAAETKQRGRWTVLRPRLVVVGTAAATLVVAVLLLPRLSSLGPGTFSPSEPPLGGSVELRIRVPDGAHTGSADAGSVWLASEATGHVTRLDATTGEVLGAVQVNDATRDPYNLWPATDGRSVWVAGRDDRSLVRIDIATMTIAARWPIDAIAYRIQPDGDAVWVTDFEAARVLRIDAADGTVLGSVRIASPTGIASTPDRVYVVGYGGELVVIDPASMAVVTRHAIAGRATDLAVIDGDLFIWGIQGRVLERFDTLSATVGATKPDVTAVATLGGQPWVALRGGLLARVDPRALSSLAVVPLGQVEADQLIASSDRLWAYAQSADGTFVVAVRPSP